MMKQMIHAPIVLAFLVVPAVVTAQAPEVRREPGRDGTVPIEALISTVAEKTGRRFIVDPRVRAQVLVIGQPPGQIDYDELLTILDVHGYMAFDDGDDIRIVPATNARQLPTPVVSDNEHHADSEYVTKVVSIETMSAAMLVPVLRPIMPQQAHLAATLCSNALIFVDTFANVERLTAVVEAIDRGPVPYDATEFECRPGLPALAPGTAPDQAPRRSRDRER